MKKLFLLVVLISSIAVKGFSQQQTADTLPYIKYPALPTFELLMSDSSTIFSTYYIPEGKPIVLIYFSPDCDHCMDFTKSLLEKKDNIKSTRIYMATPMSLPAMQEFYDKLELKKHKNLKMGKDFRYFCIRFFGIDSFPFIAVYGSDKKLVQAFHGGVKVDDVLKAVERGKE